MNVKTLLILLSWIFFLISSAFTEGPEANSQNDEKEFVIVYSPKRITLDPLHIYTTMESELSTALYEGLLSYHPFTLEPLPGVAARWEVNEDGRIYRFYLREEALYSNGDPVRAQDFKGSWLRILDPEAGAEYSFLFDVIKGAKAYRLGKNDEVEGIRVISDKTLEVELEKPAGHFLKLLSHLSFVPIHPHYLSTEEDWGSSEKVVGNGPYYITERSDRELSLKKNELYWDARHVELEKIIIRFMEDPESISREFNEGRIDWTNNWDTASLKDTSKIVFNPLFATSYFYFVCSRPPWNDERVRRALALMLPWQEIRSSRLIFATHRLIPPIPNYPEVQGIQETDLDQALSLLKEAGFPEGRGLPPLILKVPQDSESELKAQLMADTWKEKISLPVSIRVYPYETYLEEVKKDDYTLGTVNWIGDYADPLTFLQMWTGESNLNDARFMDPEFDRLIDASLSEDNSARYEKLGAAEKILLFGAVVLPISHTPAFNLIDLEIIDGWFPNILNIHPFKYFRFRKLKLPPGIAGL